MQCCNACNAMHRKVCYTHNARCNALHAMSCNERQCMQDMQRCHNTNVIACTHIGYKDLYTMESHANASHHDPCRAMNGSVCKTCNGAMKPIDLHIHTLGTKTYTQRKTMTMQITYICTDPTRNIVCDGTMFLCISTPFTKHTCTKDAHCGNLRHPNTHGTACTSWFCAPCAQPLYPLPYIY